MRNTFKIITISLLFCTISDALDAAKVLNKREQILRNEALLAVGGNITLTDNEFAVNSCLMQHKFRELDFAFENPKLFNISHHFFSYKDSIKESKVYQIIKDMPKGAALHLHDMGILGPDYLMNITYMDHLYVCLEKDRPVFRFANHHPTLECSNQWHLISEIRQSSTNVTKFDADLREHFTMVVEDPDKTYPSITDSWGAFTKYFITVEPLLAYQPVWQQYFYDTLKEFRKQNVKYVEVRSVLPSLYELDGTTYDPIVTAKSYKKALNKFKRDYPDFIGAKLIYAPMRRINTTVLGQYLDLAKRIKQQMPDFFAGFDLVGQEDIGVPLIEFVPQLTAAADELTYFFHAGETDWYGCSTDTNLVDAILLGAKRIGHGYALTKHPLLMKLVVDNDIGLEVNVLSNSILSLVKDVRNHPLATFLALDLPVVLSSDDPGAWEADVLSDDFYVTFVGVASRLADLRLLKTLALNSLKYSVLEPPEKKNAIHRFNLDWNEFVNKFRCEDY